MWRSTVTIHVECRTNLTEQTIAPQKHSTIACSKRRSHTRRTKRCGRRRYGRQEQRSRNATHHRIDDTKSGTQRWQNTLPISVMRCETQAKTCDSISTARCAGMRVTFLAVRLARGASNDRRPSPKRRAFAGEQTDAMRTRLSHQL